MVEWSVYESDSKAMDAGAFADKHGPAFLVSWDSDGQMQSPTGDTQPILPTEADEDAIRESMRATVEDLSASAGQVAVYPLRPSETAGEITVGRASDNDICLEDASVSLNHAVFRMDSAGGFLLVDRQSQNGTKIDGKSIEPNRAYDMPSGKTVSFGNVRLTFMLAWQFQEFIRAASALLRR